MRSVLFFLLGMLAMAVSAGSEEVPLAVDGTTIQLGRLQLQPGKGWFRAPARLEAEQEAYVLIQVAHSKESEKAEARYMVRFEREVDDFPSKQHQQDFYQHAAERLQKSGWKKGQVTFNNTPLPCFQQIADGETTFLLLLPFGFHSVTVYVVVPRENAGLPQSVLKLLETSSLQ